MGSLRDIEAPLEAIEFLARSVNRVQVLNTVNDGPIERRDLEDETGISRPTLSRILDDFEQRGWVVREKHRYQVTQLGMFINREFIHLLNQMKVAHILRDVVQWFPEDGFEFDLARLSTANIIRPTKQNSLAPTNHIVKRLQGATEVKVVTFTVLPVALEAGYQQVVDGSQTLEMVFSPGALTPLEGNPTMETYMHEMLTSGNASFYQYSDEIPYVLISANGAVSLCLSGADGAPRAVIDTSDEIVQSWAETQFESYRSEATPLDPAEFMA